MTEGISKVSNLQVISPELQKRIEGRSNNRTLNGETIRQDAQNIVNQAKENTKNNFLFRFLRNLGVEDPKKFLTSLSLTLATVVGLAYVGNKTCPMSAKFAEKIDDYLLNNKLYMSVTGGVKSAFQKGKDALKDAPLIGKFARNVSTTFENPLHMEAQFLRGYQRGPIGVFINTIKDIFSNSGMFKTRAEELSNIVRKIDVFGVENKTTDSLIDAVSKGIQELQKQAASLTGDELTAAQNKIQQFSTVLTELTDYKALEQNGKAMQFFKNLLGDDKKASEFYNGLISGVDSLKEAEFFNGFIDSIVSNAKANPKYATKTRAEILDMYRTGKIGFENDPEAQKILSELLHVRMGSPYKPFGQKVGDAATKTGDVIKNLFTHPIKTLGSLPVALASGFQKLAGDWWPATIIEDTGKAVSKNSNFEFCRGNLFDSLIKFDSINAKGNGVKTAPAKAFRYLATLLPESPSNFVNDKSGLGVYLCANLLSTYNDALDAPKEKKASTVADGIIGGAASWIINTPLSLALIYGVSTFKKMPIQGPVSAILHGAGKVIGLGLGHDKSVKSFKNTLTGVAGGALRLALFFWFVNPKISKMTSNIMQKIYGKPYDRDEEKRKKEIIPQLGITNEEFEKKLEANPKAIEELQKNPQLLKRIQSNPKLLLDYLDGKEIISQTPFASSNAPRYMSEANLKLINSRNHSK